jgi:hypothetical protein
MLRLPYQLLHVKHLKQRDGQKVPKRIYQYIAINFVLTRDFKSKTFFSKSSKSLFVISFLNEKSEFNI